MRTRGTIRYVLVSMALLSLLLLATTLGGIFHHHAGSSDTNCSICHLNHQAADRPLAGHREPSLNLIGPRLEFQELQCAPAIETPRLPARAPPSA
jgi:hypothetical protein